MTRGSAFNRFLKNRVLRLPGGRKARTIPFGIYRGIRAEIDFRHQFQYYLGLWEAETHPWLRRFARGINTAIDIGAASGEHTLYFAVKTGARKVYAFEPSADLCRRIRENLALNPAAAEREVVILQQFVGETDGNGRVTLDSLRDSLEFPCLVKIDIDGGEVEALRGARELLRRPGVRWLIETHSLDLERGCSELLSAAGYVARIVPNAWWRAVVPEQRHSEINRWLAAYRAEDDRLITGRLTRGKVTLDNQPGLELAGNSD